jgi:hypothetical protein
LLVAVMIGPMLNAQLSSGGNAGAAKNVNYRLYFGDLHTHTEYSDAWEGTPWDAYQAAIDGGADFMATTDHVSIWNAYKGQTTNSEDWADTLAAADYFTSKNFVAMPGYETWLLGHLGEINVYNVPVLPPEEPLGYRFDRLPNLYDWLAQQPGAVGQFNHPYYMTDDYEDFGYYTPTRDSVMNIIEVWNSQCTEEDYVMALDAGWHLMPSANSDTHNPDWISGYEERTVLLTDKLTPENLYAAMRAHRGYATLDKNLEIYYTLDGAIMGSNLSAPDGSYTASIRISDPDGMKDEITLVEVVSDGGEVVARIPTSGNSVDLTVHLSSDSAQYFYVRVTTASPLDGAPGLTAWTAPVWTGR